MQGLRFYKNSSQFEHEWALESIKKATATMPQLDFNWQGVPNCNEGPSMDENGSR
jgi:hypothetical protein